MRYRKRPDLGALGTIGAALATMLALGAGGPAHLLGTAPAVAMPAPTLLLRHMPSTSGGLRLDGAVDEIDWPVVLTSAQAAHARRFRLTYTAAISVVPDLSTLEIDINGHEIGRPEIDATGKTTVDIDVPTGTLRQGLNAISLTARQHHRVDCSMAATYELWTRIDPDATGLVLPTEDGALEKLADLPAILPAADGRLPIHVLLAGKLGLLRIRQIIAATQSIAIAAHSPAPVIDFERDPDDVEGLDLMLGTRDELRRLPEWPRIGDRTDPVFLTSISRHPTLVVTGTTDADVDAAGSALRAMIGANGRPDPVSPHRFAAHGASTSFSLAEIGIPSRSADGSLLHQAIEVSLPADVLLSDYGRGTLDLAATYAADLERTAQVRINVNGHSAGIVRMPRRAGGSLDHDQLFLPLSAMRPGVNRIDLLAEVPRKGDDACAQRDGTRFQLLGATRVSLPDLARGLRLPDVGLATAGAVPYDRGTPHLVVPSPDRAAMAAAFSLAAKEAVTAGRPIPFEFSTHMPQVDDGSTLVVAAVQTLDPGVMREIGLDPSAVENAWHDAAAAPRPQATRWWLRHPDSPPACRGGALDAASPAKELRDDVRADDALRRRLTEWAAIGTEAARGWLGARLQKMWLPSWAAEAPTRIPSSAVLILAQGISPGSHKNVTTIVAAPTSAGLLESMGCLFDPRVWPEVRGRLAVLGGDGQVDVTDATAFTYVASAPASLHNMRLVVAQWFSLNPLAFAAMGLVTAFLLSGSTLWLVRNVGRRTS